MTFRSGHFACIYFSLFLNTCFFLTLRACVEGPSELEERTLTSLLNVERCEGEEQKNTEHGQLDHNANKCHSPEKREHKATRQQNQEETKDRQGHMRTEYRKGEEKAANVVMNMQKETQPFTFNDSTGECGLQGYLTGP